MQTLQLYVAQEHELFRKKARHPEQLSHLFGQAGMRSVKAFPLMFGLTHVHEGLVP